MNILVSTSSFGEYDAKPLDVLNAGGYSPVLNPHGRTLKPVELLQLAAGCPGIVAGTERFDRETLAGLPELKVISRVGSGVDNVDLAAAAEFGIAVRNTPDGPGRAVAELTIGLTLSLLRGIPKADNLVRQGVWKKNMGHLLADRRVGIIGLGRIGKEVAGLFQAFGCRVAACDLQPDIAWAAEHGIELVGLDTLLAGSDIVSIHVAAAGHGDGGSGSQVNRYLLGEGELVKLKPGAVLVNTARGEFVDEAALFKLLADGRLGGAALDVFADEPYTGRLRELPNVVLTPHIGSYAIEVRVKMEIEAVENLMFVLNQFSGANHE